MRQSFAILLLILLAAIPRAASGAFERSVHQYHHRHWSEESDAPRPVFAIAQDRRGYIWIAAATGLFRFDGISFEEISKGFDLVKHGPPSSILVRRNGDIWTSFGRSGRFAVYRGGELKFMRAPRAPDRVIDMQEAGDGTVWILTERIGLPLMRYRGGRWSSFGRAAGAPEDNPFSMVIARDGSLWVSFTASVMRLSAAREDFETKYFRRRMLGRLATDREGRIWLTEARGSYPITGVDGRGSPPARRHAYATDTAEIRGRPLFDREGNLWIATYYDGLQRVAQPDPRGAPSPTEARRRVENFTAREGLSSNAMTAVFQDREGNIWVGTENGIDRFWPATIRYEPRLTDPAAFGDLLLRASDGAVYIAQASTVYRVAPHGSLEPILGTAAEPTTLCEAPDGAIWIGDGKRVAIWQAGRVRWLPTEVPLASTLYDCAFDAAGDYWVTAALGGMARLRAGRWDRPWGPARDDFLPKSMVTGRNGKIYVQWNDRSLGRIDGTIVSKTAIPWGGYEPDDAAFYPARDGSLFVAGRFGIARFRSGRFQTIPAQRMPPFSGINGIAETPTGDIWLAGSAGIMQIPAADLHTGFADPGRRLRPRIFGSLDGLRSLPHDHSRRSIVRGGDGRLWIATQTGTLWLDPVNIARNRAPPTVSISALSADRLYRDPAQLTLPAGTTDIEIDFAILGFSNPRANEVRYRLAGQGNGWVAAGTRRQAFFTNLAPGDYRFEVTASNDEGVWSDTGASVDFTIPPTFVQSRWFLLLCAALAGLLLWAVLRWRYAAAMRRLHARLEERVAERERIAHDLHDTLLQGVQGLVLQVQAAVDRMAGTGTERASLQRALDLADEVIAEGRDRVQALRGRNEGSDLEVTLRNLVAARPLGPPAQVRIEVSGQKRPVDPLIASEIALIGSEALFNIAQHAHASVVDIAILFHLDALEVRFADDGQGLPEDVLARGGRDGHFGLVTMRERAARIGGKVTIRSAAGEGTIVAVQLAAGLAYLGAFQGKRWRRLKSDLAAKLGIFSAR